MPNPEETKIEPKADEHPKAYIRRDVQESHEESIYGMIYGPSHDPSGTFFTFFFHSPIRIHMPPHPPGDLSSSSSRSSSTMAMSSLCSAAIATSETAAFVSALYQKVLVKSIHVATASGGAI